MDLHLLIGIIAGFLVMVGLLFLSMIHLFMIPKDVLKRDTTRQPHLEGNHDAVGVSSRTDRDMEKPEIKQNPQQKPEPEIENYPRPEPEVEREPGQQDDPEPERRRA